MIHKDDILKLTGKGLAVFRYYLPCNWKFNKPFLNPLYNDTKASCIITMNKDRTAVVMSDYGSMENSGDCFDIVAKLLGYNPNDDGVFKQVLSIINRDLGLGLDSSQVSVAPTKAMRKIKIDELTEIYDSPKLITKKEYSLKTKEFTISELEYWGNYGITKDHLETYNVVSVADFSFVSQHGKTCWFTSSKKEPIYGYLDEQYVKIYCPFSATRFTYGGNTPQGRCFGMDQLSAKADILFITGGEKDVMSLYARGFNAICFNSETSIIPINIIDRLTYRFKHIVLLYDMDHTGLESSLKHQKSLEKYNVLRMLLPLSGTKEDKDISDFFSKGNTADDLRTLFAELLTSRYDTTVSILKSCEVSLKIQPPESETIISVNDVALGANGNILCITGGEGTGKSNFIGALIAGALSEGNLNVDTLGVTVSNNILKLPIILYDTEQSRAQVFKNSTNIVRRAKRNDEPYEFHPYYFTSLSRDVRLKSIIESLDLFYYQYGGIFLVVIDGIADLISGANNESESIAIVEELYRLAARYDTCIVCVLHFIPNGLKLRGHLGSELQRKSAAILSIEKDTDNSNSGFSLIKALKVRDGSPLDVPVIRFGWCNEQQMHIYKGEKERTKRKDVFLKKAAEDIFNDNVVLTDKELNEKLQDYCGVQTRTAGNYISYLKEHGVISEDSSCKESYRIIKQTN